MSIRWRGSALFVVVAIALTAGAIPAAAEPAGSDRASIDARVVEPGSMAADLPPLSSPALNVPVDVSESLESYVVAPDGATVYMIESSGDEVLAFDVESRSVRARITVPHYPSLLTLSADGRRLYVGNDEGTWVLNPSGLTPGSIAVIDTASDRIIRTVPLPHARFDSMEITDGGSRLNVLYEDSVPYTSESYMRAATLDLRSDGPLVVAPLELTPDQSLPVLVDASGSVFTQSFTGGQAALHRWDVTTGTEISSVRLTREALDLDVTADGRTAVLRELDGLSSLTRLEVVDLTTMSSRGVIDLPDSTREIRLAPDGLSAAVMVEEKIVLVDIAGLNFRTIDLTNTADASQPFFLADGRLGVSVNEYGGDSSITLYLIDPQSLAVLVRVPHAGGQQIVSPDGDVVYGVAENPVITPSGFERNPAVSIVDLDVADWHPAVDRVAGADRFRTAVAASLRAFPAGAAVAFVVSGANFADALSATSAASERGGPLLLTERDRVPSSVLAELRRLHPEGIVVVGGPASVGPAAVAQLKALKVPVTVLGGIDRYATARAVVADTWPKGADHVYVANGATFPDALSAAPAAAATDSPLLIVNGRGGSLDAPTRALLDDLHVTSFTVVGGPAGVSEGVANALAERGSVERLAGMDRYATSAAVSEAAFPAPEHVFMASGGQFPDALSGGVVAVMAGSPLYIVPPACIPVSTAEWLAAVPISAVTLFGGPAALSERAGALGIC